MSRSPIDFAATLNPEQLAAVTHEDGPQLVIAGAGSGKTRVITYRVAWLVQERGVEPGHIAAVTFTNKAAAEMRERVEGLLGLYPLPAFVGTFHRFALRLLRRYAPKVGLPRDFAILDTSDQLTVLKRAMKSAGVPEDSFRPRAVLGAISQAKNKLLGPQKYGREADDFFTRKVAAVYEHYQAALREAGGVDFDDMIRLSVELMRGQDTIRRWVQERFRHLLVDEFQDTNHAQLELVRQLVGSRGRLTAVGDEDQGIYRWRGAELTHILGFERTFEGAVVRKLERNYRSTQTILDASGAVVARNEQRRGKTLWTEAGDGERLLLYRGQDEQDEARWIANTLQGLEAEHGWRRMAVLVRTNAQTRAIEDAFLRRGVPYSLVAGVRFYERAEIKDLVAYLRLARNPNDVLAFERVLNRPPRGIGKTTRSRLDKAAEAEGLTPWTLLQDDALLARHLKGRAVTALQRFRDLVLELQSEAEILPLPSLLRHVLDATGFLDQFDANDADDKTRLENIEELLSAAQEFTEKNTYGSDEDVLTAFLDQSALAADTDRLGGPGVSLMTLHSAKGLEFRVVVVAGLEEGLLPHFNSRSHADDLEEERRLFYVGMTRAQERLVLTTCRRRRVAGNWQDQDESRFLAEVPTELMHVETSPELFTAASRGGSRSGASWGGGRGPSSGSGATSSSARDVLSFFGRGGNAGSGGETTIDVSSDTGSRHAPQRLPFAPTTPSGGALKRGCRVRHEKFGLGKVLSIDGEGESAKLLVYFDSVGRRKMIAKYANLDVL
ncbi:MAG: UvrD-helicase domain-containing protein [Acidobacteriota bacterium]